MKKTLLVACIACVCAVFSTSAKPLLDADFSGPLAGQGGWIGRDGSIRLDGEGRAGLAQKSDGFAKHPLELPDGLVRIRFSARVRFSALPGSAMRNHHIVGTEQPAWIALGFMDNASEKAGLAACKLAVSVSSDGQTVSVGLGRAVGAEAPSLGVFQAAGTGDCGLALEYDFATGTATALLDGKPVLSGSATLSPSDFALAAFQLRRIAPEGGLADLSVECQTGPALAALPAVLPEPERPFGVRTNAEVERARRIEARIDGAKTATETLAALQEGWANPPATYRPHTRWWWPGNAVTKAGIDFQLQEMKEKGFGGVEIMSFISVFTKGNIDFNSDEFVAMTKYAVDKARELGMEVTPALTPGWNHGHALVPEEDAAKAMTVFTKEVEGGAIQLSLAGWEPRDTHHGWGSERASRKFGALVAVALDGQGSPDPARRIDLTGKVSGNKGMDRFSTAPDLELNAVLPPGRWRLMAFWTALTGQKCAADDSSPASRIVDHMDRGAVERYLRNAGARFVAALGGDYGQTVDSFFGDSWEVHHDFSFWSDALFDRFEQEKGYDLRPWLPLLVYDGAPETPYVRYDFGHFLHVVGMDSMVRPLAAYAAQNNVGMRQQPHYRFTADIIEQSGVFQRPETENTKRSFDPMFWHKLTTSGAWLYPSQGRKWVSCEAFTFINEKYRTTMEEIKRGTDLFLRDGVTQFYNHGYFYTPEKELAPSRDLLWMNRISHVNTWWPWYRGLADYQARAAFLARQGRPECEVLVYAPYPTLWSERAEYPVKSVRDLPFGPLPKILVANGYDFDCVNDDLLLNHARFDGGKIAINGFGYSVLILPRTIVLAPETLEKIAAFVESGGTVMALETLPGHSAGLMNREANDAKLAGLCDHLFNPDGGMKKAGQGTTWFFPGFEGLEYLTRWSPGSIEWQPTAPLSAAQAGLVAALRKTLAPDFEIADAPQSDGLTFRRTKIGELDCWFICNLQPTASKTEVTLATKGKVPQAWDAMTGTSKPVAGWRVAADGRSVIPVALEAWESVFVVLAPDGPAASKAANHRTPESMALAEDWNVSFQGLGRFATNLSMQALAGWTAIEGLENVSGTATYQTVFDLPSEISNLKSEIILHLGEVHEVASVRVNGQEAGRVWMQPYRVDISKQVKPGKNRLEITVANRLWNYAASLEQPTPVPAELQAHYGTGDNPRYNAWNNLQTLKGNKKNDRLPSGLLGPVELRYGKEATK